MVYYDTNESGAINPEDNIDETHYASMVEYCDFNDDGSIDACEVHACLLICENEYRAANCPEYGAAYCSCPFTPDQCNGAWNCADIAMYLEEVMAYYDVNGDG
jgi:hypothetical protein